MTLSASEASSPFGGRFYIVTPTDHPDEIPALAEAGADEVYCGVLPLSLSMKNGDWDCLSRRGGRIANLSSFNQLQQVATLAQSFGLKASLALNLRYTAEQIPEVLELAAAWEEAGGTAVILSSLELLLMLQQRGSKLHRHISILSHVINSQAAAFFRRMGASRVILPTELRVPEISDLTSSYPEMDYEVNALDEKCRFVVGLCGFYRGRMFSDQTASVFPFETVGADRSPVAYEHDLCYAGHGCEVPFVDESGRQIIQPIRDDMRQPACAGCDLSKLHHAGVRFLKIGSRGMSLAAKQSAIRFLRDASNVSFSGADIEEICRLYSRAFGKACRKASCFYWGRFRRED
jgi:collagenase-like PrtC family protease